MSEPTPTDDLLASLGQISRMRLFPDDRTNRLTLLAAIAVAEAALAKWKSRTEETPDV